MENVCMVCMYVSQRKSRTKLMFFHVLVSLYLPLPALMAALCGSPGSIQLPLHWDEDDQYRPGLFEALLHLAFLRGATEETHNTHTQC